MARTLPALLTGVKHLCPPDCLRVRRILDLDPARAAAVDLIAAVRPLPDDAFKVALARDTEQINAARIREARNPSSLGSQMQSLWLKGSGMRRSRMGVMCCMFG